MKKVLMALVIICTLVDAKDIYPDVKVTRLIRGIDGDTFVCDIDSLSDIVGKNISIRIKSINTPELRDKNPEIKKLAYIEKERLAKILKNAKVIELKNLQRDKYFRIAADIYIDDKPLIIKLNPKYFTAVP